ncbi:MAG: hypothetical protein IKW74_01880, partial [Thermoguttaceae bacterium]|nr:hypothetical protein [Thermoguttaceae bacterium]
MLMLNSRSILGKQGRIAQRLKRYEYRDAQLQMAEEVESVIKNREHLAIEAGTGVGKSFAYLVPSILYAVESQVREFSETGFSDITPEPGQTGDLNAGQYSDAPLPHHPDTPLPHREPALDSGESPESKPRPETASCANSDRQADSSQRFGNEEELSIGYEQDDDPEMDLRRVVVSTHTISLQEQLYTKDIPFLGSVLPFEFTSVLVKGRSNYLCLRRLDYAVKKSATLIEDESLKDLTRIRKWSLNTVDGSLSDLYPKPETSIWPEVCCEQGNCLGRNCSFHQKCFYQKARRQIENAQILIVNHALLFSDLAIRRAGGSILPKYDILIFDEAH